MASARRWLADGWAPSASVVLHGAALIAILSAIGRPVVAPTGERAVPVTLVNLAPPPVSAPPPPAPVVEEPPPPPVVTTAPEVHDIAPPPRKIRPKRVPPKPPAPPKVEAPADPRTAPRPATVTSVDRAPPQQSAPAAAPSPSYLALLRQKLERNKVYPHSARLHREQGTAVLRFTVDRSGHVLASKIEKSTGHPDLDREVTAMLNRAQPLPPMPPEMKQARLELVVPVQFYLR